MRRLEPLSDSFGRVYLSKPMNFLTAIAAERCSLRDDSQRPTSAVFFGAG
jgi:hypothetical protein